MNKKIKKGHNWHFLSDSVSWDPDLIPALRTPDSCGLQIWTGMFITGTQNSQTFGFRLNNITVFPESLACRWQVLGHHGLRNNMSQFFIISLFIYVYVYMCFAKSLQPCPTLCDPMNCSLPDSSVSGILQASILEWVSTPSSRGSSWPSDWTLVSYISWVGRWVLYH